MVPPGGVTPYIPMIGMFDVFFKGCNGELVFSFRGCSSKIYLKKNNAGICKGINTLSYHPVYWYFWVNF